MIAFTFFFVIKKRENPLYKTLKTIDMGWRGPHP
jgi:hypothetical protein